MVFETEKIDQELKIKKFPEKIQISWENMMEWLNGYKEDVYIFQPKITFKDEISEEFRLSFFVYYTEFKYLFDNLFYDLQIQEIDAMIDEDSNFKPEFINKLREILAFLSKPEALIFMLRKYDSRFGTSNFEEIDEQGMVFWAEINGEKKGDIIDVESRNMIYGGTLEYLISAIQVNQRLEDISNKEQINDLFKLFEYNIRKVNIGYARQNPGFWPGFEFMFDGRNREEREKICKHTIECLTLCIYQMRLMKKFRKFFQ